MPVLANPDKLAKPLADSQDISLYIAEHFPRLQPPELRDDIIKGLTRLHQLNYFTLSFTGKPAVVVNLRSIVEKDLADPNSSPRYRKALEHKLEM